MEAFVPSTVAALSMSNTDLESLRRIYDLATIKPAAVQNRFTGLTVDNPDPSLPSNLPYPLVTWDRDVRQYCAQNGIAYAPWGELWGSLDALDGEEKNLEKAGKEMGFSREIACYTCLRSLGGCTVSILCGTTNEGRMRETLEGLKRVKVFVEESEVKREIWKRYVDRFRAIVDG